MPTLVCQHSVGWAAAASSLRWRKQSAAIHGINTAAPTTLSARGLGGGCYFLMGRGFTAKPQRAQRNAEGERNRLMEEKRLMINERGASISELGKKRRSPD